ncbi:MAG TPA: cysteine desulfurase family protein [Bacteroidia bacterium]|nr:cysteine desulfurase family protein [Bacteroidia bacterium]
MNVYLDNAATTPLDPEVLEVMLPIMQKQFGNPSSIHSFGRETRTIIEKARKTVANLLNASPSEIFFTSGGTEANNTAIRCSINDLGIKHCISTKIEHHAVEHTLAEICKKESIKLSYINIDKKGNIDLHDLEELLKSNEKSLVSLMHANNELGTLTPLEKTGELCRKYDAVFHSDTVQTMGHYVHDLKKIPVDFITCAAHKFHGPKGVGFLYINNRVKIHPFITGGAQERNMRGGTENVYGIAGLAKALEIAYRDMEHDLKHIAGLRSYMIDKLKNEIPEIDFNSETEKDSLYTVLNVSFPPSDFSEMLLFNLDIAGIAASGGSACSSGSNVGSHVLNGIGADPNRPAVRFSFSKYNTKAEIDFVVEKLKELYAVKV